MISISITSKHNPGASQKKVKHRDKEQPHPGLSTLSLHPSRKIEKYNSKRNSENGEDLDKEKHKAHVRP
jgi:hypothetical protein